MPVAALAKDLTVLGIETSCDETAAAVVRRRADGSGEILSNVVRSQLEEHARYGGVVPEIAARAHLETLEPIVGRALNEAGIGLGDLSAIAATAGPGLIGGLLVGLTTGKALALAAGRPLIAVNHLEAHALTPGLTDGLSPPYLLLLVSGGHTQTLVVEAVGRYRRIGTTIDDALGEAFDKTAKLLGLGFPGGPAVERAARDGDPFKFALPRPMLGRAEPHFSFAGLKTAVRNIAIQHQPLTDATVADLCASFEAAVTAIVAERVGRAVRLLEDGRAAGAAPIRHLVVAGGVAANRRLRAALTETADALGLDLVMPPAGLCTDNAAMIAWAGAELMVAGRSGDLDAPARARWPLDAEAEPVLGAGRAGAKA
ncbi:MAG: tRNA (adenosine(37)-N6)-threonylcarbamoyltransferase complex transferase subunit TsaD [Hyphomicrobiaceae bacterium]